MPGLNPWPAQQGADEESLSTPPEERDSTTPDWLLEMEESGTETQPEQKNEFVIEDVSDSPLTEKMPSETVDLTRTDEMPSDPAEAFAWLESLAAQQGADEESLSTPPEERDSATPDWLLEMEETGTETQPEQESSLIEEDVPLPALEDHLSSQVSAQSEQPPETTLPDWLKEFEQPLAEETPTDPETVQQGSQDETVVRWLQKMDEEEPLSEEPAGEPPAARSASKDIITEPVKAVAKPAAEAIPADDQVEIKQPVVEEPSPEILRRLTIKSIWSRNPSCRKNSKLPSRSLNPMENLPSRPLCSPTHKNW